MRDSRKAFYFIMDAMLAAVLILSVVYFMYNSFDETKETSQLTNTARDISLSLSNIQIKDVEDAWIQTLIANGTIENPNQSVLAQIAEFWATDNNLYAENLSKLFVESSIPDRFGVELSIDSDNVYAKDANTTGRQIAYESSAVSVQRGFISGIGKLKPLKGSSGVGFLNKIRGKRTSSYLYFGGFAGQGNITAVIRDIPSDVTSNDITNITLQADAISEFDVYLNNQFCTTASPSAGNLTVDTWDLTGCNASISSGDNTVQLNFSGIIDEAYLAGGILKISYTTDEIHENIDTESMKFWLPGIDGVVNVFDSFYVPGVLQDVGVYLHYYANHSQNANNSFYLTIGNDTVYIDKNSTTEQFIFLDTTELSAETNVSAFSLNTTPIRMGFENLSFKSEFFGNADVIISTDVSGSMRWVFYEDWNDGTPRNCDDADINASSSRRISVAKCLDKMFAEDIINITGNRIGLTSYADTLKTAETVAPTTNLTPIYAQIGTEVPQTGYNPNGGTCICCGINGAVDILTGNFSRHEIISSGDTWFYLSNYTNSEPPDQGIVRWFELDYNHGEWFSGPAVLGVFDDGLSPTIDTDMGGSNSSMMYPNLWELAQDDPAPIDFTNGLNYTTNTYGLNNTQQVISNPYFSGPSTTGWNISGTANTGQGTVNPFSFNDDFESGGIVNGGWTTGGGGSTSVQSEYAYEGTYAMRGRGNSKHNNGWWEKELDTTGIGDLRLSFNYRGRGGWENSGGSVDYIYVEVNDGSWNTVSRWQGIDTAGGNASSSYTFEEFDLSGYSMQSDFKVRFRHHLTGSSEYWHVDNVTIYDNTPPVTDIYDLQDYIWFSSDNGSSSSINQTFFSSTSSPAIAEVRLTTSTHESTFLSFAQVYCNLTHPGGDKRIWEANWTTDFNVVGPSQTTIDIASFISDAGFAYSLTCGVEFDGVNGTTVVAMDDILIDIDNGDDGWDAACGMWDGDGQCGAGNDVYLNGDPDGNGDLFDNTVNADNRLRVSIGANYDDGSDVIPNSGGYGIQFRITQEMMDLLASPTGSAKISFDYEKDHSDSDGDAAGWIKAEFGTLGTMQFLGSELDAGYARNDSTREIFFCKHYECTPDPYSATFTQDVTSMIADDGVYYFTFGGKATEELGDSGWDTNWHFYFDNIQLTIQNDTDKYYLRRNFTLGANETQVVINVLSDDRAKVLVNGNLVDDDVVEHTAKYWNRPGIIVTGEHLNVGNNVVAVQLFNDGEASKFDLELAAVNSSRDRAIMVMTDGEANDECARQGVTGDLDNDGSSDTAKDDAIQAACDAKEIWGITTYAVGFSDSADEATLEGIASCGGGLFKKSDDTTELSNFYADVAQTILLASRKSQSILVEGDLSPSVLYPDSYIEFNFTSQSLEPLPSEISVARETSTFGGCNATVNISGNFRILDANIVSYSGDHWTKYVEVNGQQVFNLTEFSSDYIRLGDPFRVPVPPDLLNVGALNDINIMTGDVPWNETGCSQDNKMLYRVLIDSDTERTDVVYNAEGCTWEVEHDDGSYTTFGVPSSYSGSNLCYYNSTHTIYNNQDAYDLSAINLLTQLDFDSDGRVFFNFEEEDIEIVAKTVSSVPYMWGPAVVEVRVWGP